MSGIAQQVVLGLLLGGVYTAIALGFGLVWGVLNIVNLAHGALVLWWRLHHLVALLDHGTRPLCRPGRRGGGPCLSSATGCRG